MNLKFTIPTVNDILPRAEELADAWRFGIELLIKKHLIARDESSPPNGLMQKRLRLAFPISSLTICEAKTPEPHQKQALERQTTGAMLPIA